MTIASFHSIAVLGTGVMGTAIGKRLIELGYRVYAYNRHPERTRELAAVGVTICPTPAHAVAQADLGLTVLTDTDALQCVALGKNGIVEAGVTVPLIDVGTHDPTALFSVSQQIEKHGIRFIEAPMTGSVHDVSHGTLGFLVGGCHENVSYIRPFLEHLGRQVFHLGPIGTGNTAKLALNLLVGVMALGLSESIAMLRAAKVDIASFLSAVDVSGLQSPLYRRVGDRYLQQDFATRFSLANLEKDIGYVVRRALQLDLEPTLAKLLADRLQGIDSERKRSDYSSLVAWVADGR